MNALGKIAQSRYKVCDQRYGRTHLYTQSHTDTHTHTSTYGSNSIALKCSKRKSLQVSPCSKLVRRLIDNKKICRILLKHFLFRVLSALYNATKFNVICVRSFNYVHQQLLHEFSNDQWWLSGHCDFVLLLILLPKYHVSISMSNSFVDATNTQQKYATSIE